MKKLFYFISACGIVIISLNSCEENISTSNLYTPTESDVTSNATLDQLQQGRDLYIKHCAECHQLYSPDNFSASSWSSIMSKMAPKTSMNQSQVDLVKKYVTRGSL